MTVRAASCVERTIARVIFSTTMMIAARTSHLLLATTKPSVLTQSWIQREKNMMGVPTPQCQEGPVRLNFFLDKCFFIECHGFQKWRNLQSQGPAILFMKDSMTFNLLIISSLGMDIHNPAQSRVHRKSEGGGQQLPQPRWRARTLVGKYAILFYSHSFLSQLCFRCYTTDPDKRWELCPDLTCS